MSGASDGNGGGGAAAAKRTIDNTSVTLRTQCHHPAGTNTASPAACRSVSTGTSLGRVARSATPAAPPCGPGLTPAAMASSCETNHHSLVPDTLALHEYERMVSSCVGVHVPAPPQYRKRWSDTSSASYALSQSSRKNRATS